MSLRAGVIREQAIAMPSQSAWSKWGREVTGRLERIEPVVPDEVVRGRSRGRLELLAWQGEPEANVLITPDGQLRLHSIELRSWQAVELPRKWDDPSRRQDKQPGEQLVAMFNRVRLALHAWMEVMDHLVPGRR